MAVAFVNASAYQSSGVNTLAVNMPASIVAGNLLLVFLRFSGTTAPTAPAGWTMKASDTTHKVAVAYRIATGSEAASYTFTCGVGQIFSDAFSVQISGAVASGDPFDGAVQMGSSNGVLTLTSAALSLTTTVANAYLFYVDMKNGATRTLSSAPTGMTNRGPASQPDRLHYFDMVQAAAGASGSKQATYTTTSLHYDLLMAILPADTPSNAGFLGLL